MKRLLSLALCLVLVLGLFAGLALPVSAAGDALTVYAKSGGRRNVAVGDTVTYSYALKLSGIYNLDRIRLDVIYDEACLEFVSVEYPSFSSGMTETVRDGVLHIEKGTITNGSIFSQSISDIFTVTFRAKRAGTTYIRTLPQRIEVEGGKESDIYLIENYRPSEARDALFSTYDYLGDNTPTNATTKLNTSQDVVWFYLKDANGDPVEAGQRFLLSGTDENGKLVSYSAETDAFGLVCYPRVPFGSYSISCDSVRADGSAYFVDDAGLNVPPVKNGALSVRREVTARLLQPEDMIDLRVSLAWADEFIDPGVPYSNDRPTNVTAALEAGGAQYAHAFLSADQSSVLLKNLPRMDADGNELDYELVPGVMEHYNSEIIRTDDGFVITLRYLNDHDWTKERIEPDCDKSGEVIYTCSDCGDVYHHTLAPLGHDYAESGYGAACEKTGYHLYVCKRCSNWYAETTPALGHSWGAWFVDQDIGENGEDGHRYRVCSVCGERQEYIIAGPEHKHAYHTHVVNPTCTEGGYTEKLCLCGDCFIMEGSRTDALGHDFTGSSSTRTVIENSCTVDGLVEYTCSRCGEMHAELLPAHGHHWGDWKVTIPASQTESGYEERTCSICGDTQARVIPAVGISVAVTPTTDVPEVSAAIAVGDTLNIRVTNGSSYSAYDFTASFSNSGVAQIQGSATVNIPVGGDVTFAVKGLADGNVDITISNNNSYSEQYTRKAIIHLTVGSGIAPSVEPTVEPTSTPAPTCTHPNTAISGKKDATCSETGYTGDTVCLKCGQTIKFGETIPALPHTWSAWTTVIPATDTETGVEARVCRVCKAIETRSIPKTGPFKDVPASAYYHDSVLWAYTHEPQITSGYADGSFRPDQVCTRAQVVTFLWRAAGEPEPRVKINPFHDVSNSAYYFKAVLWAVERGITTGLTPTAFNPNGECTRAQVVTFLWRAAGEPEPVSTTNPFQDVSASAYYYQAVLWALENKITTGNTPTTFNPTGKCTRAHVVTFLYRANT